LDDPTVTLHLFYYYCLECQLASALRIGKDKTRPADMKLGGVCGDVPAECVAHIIYAVTGVRVQAIDLFGKNLGRCNLWLGNPSIVPTLIERIDRRLWMAPLCHRYCVVANDDRSREYLLWYLEMLRVHGPTKKVPFPRHLVTAERWTV